MTLRRQRAFRTTPAPCATRKARRWSRPAAFLSGLGLLAALAGPRDALAYGVTLDTSALAGLSGRLEFVLLDGDTVADNSVVIANLASNGTFVGADCSIGCTGGPSYTLDDTLGFGQLLYDLTLGTSVSFDLTFSTNYGGVAGIDPPDRFALSLLDPGTNFSLVATDLAFPDDALLTVDLTGAGVIQAASTVTPSVAVAIPEPGSLALAAIALLALAGRRAGAGLRRFIPGR